MADESTKLKHASMGEVEYRRGASDRIGESYHLPRVEAFAGSAYLAGRGEEGALRAVLWKADPDIQRGKKSLDTGHDLRQLLTNVRNLGLLRAGGPDDPLVTAVQRVARPSFRKPGRQLDLFEH